MNYQESMNRQVQPFDVGDLIVMDHEGYAMPKGRIAKVKEVKYVTGTGWCVVAIDSVSGSYRGYRALRFSLYEKGNPDMQPFYVIYPAFKNRDGEYSPELNSLPEIFRGTENELKERIKTRLKNLPEGAKLLYGLVSKVAEIDAPPVRISSL
jgi:hypothetical protein